MHAPGRVLKAVAISDVAARPGFAEPRRIVLPFAVSPGPPGRRDFRVSALDGCSSFLKPAPAGPGGSGGAQVWGHLLKPPGHVDMEAVMAKCRRKAYTVSVPTLSLEGFLDLVFGAPGGAPRFDKGGGNGGDDGSLSGGFPRGVAVEYVKVDAQGFDLEVVRSLGAYLPLTANVEVEVALGTPLYAGAAGPREVDAFMAASGFAFAPPCAFALHFNLGSVERTR